MKYVPRLLWLLAWSLWLLLGLGLYRELPRNIGLPLHELPISQGLILGFVADSNRVATFKPATINPSTVAFFDAETGRLVNQIEGPATNKFWCRSPEALRHGVLIVNRPSEKIGNAGWVSSLQLFDLVRGQWRELTKHRGTEISIHPTRPWVVFNEYLRIPVGTSRAVVIDFQAGKEIFARDLPRGAPRYPDPLFVGDDLVLVQVPRIGDDRRWTHSLEIWRIVNSPTLENTIDDLYLGRVVSIGGSRFSFSGSPNVSSFGVFDVAQNRILFGPSADDELFDPRMRRRGSGAPPLSPSGRSMLGGDPRALRDVDSMRVLWRPAAPEFTFQTLTREHFQVIEPWQVFWERWFPNLKFETWSLRTLETGALVFRIPAQERRMFPYHRNAAGTLVVAEDGAVYRLPFRPNWSLLALCQSLLALPLILLWLLLRYRRQRRLRLAEAAP